MGAGASTSDAAEKAAAATVEEIEAQLAALPADTRDKLKVAVANLEKASQTPQTAIRAEEEAKDISTPRVNRITQDPHAEQQRLSKLAEAAGAAVASMEPWQEDVSESAWKKFDGALIESELSVVENLGESPVRLVDARFLIELEKRGGIFIRRQDLPETAFLSLEKIKRLPKGGKHGDCLRIIGISHPWQHPDHPDQKSINLKLLARVLTSFIEDGGGTYAIFLDVRPPRVHCRRTQPEAHNAY